MFVILGMKMMNPYSHSASIICSLGRGCACLGFRETLHVTDSSCDVTVFNSNCRGVGACASRRSGNLFITRGGNVVTEATQRSSPISLAPSGEG